MTKTAIVTGAASGLGFELAYLLARDNYNLVLIDIDELKLKKVKALFNKEFKNDINIIVKDLSKPNVAKGIFNEFKHLNIDVLVNSAGFGLFGTFADTDWERESEMLHLHILTTTHLTKLILPSMISRKSGKILNISSLAAFQPGPLMSMYYASKSYILSFSEAIANELKNSGVTVTALCPGPTKTSFQAVVSENTSDNKISFNMACPSKVALFGYKAMQKGQTVAIPGLINKLLASLHRIVTRSMATKIVRNIQEKNKN